MIKERDVYITPDGVSYPLHVPASRVVLTEEGTGMPPIDYITRRGPFQHGDTVLDYFLRPRVLQLVIYHNYCNRQALWTGRTGLLNALRPNRQTTGVLTPGKLRKYLPDGTVRDIDVFIQQGPAFGPRDLSGWREWAYQETLRFVAHDPTYYNPTLKTQTFAGSGAAPLTFPITFPISFSSFNIAASIAYIGSWLSYPTFEIRGPLASIVIDNETTDEQISLAYSIPDNRVVTVDLSFGQKTITLDDGTNLIGYLTTGSDLATFHLAPDPEAAGGTNSIVVYGTGSGANTRVIMQWYERFIGL